MKRKALVEPETLGVEPVDTQTEGKGQYETEGDAEPRSCKREATTSRSSAHELSRSLRILREYIIALCSQQCWLLAV
jgi:hypothetical protein